jgi:hypothetical protein
MVITTMISTNVKALARERRFRQGRTPAERVAPLDTWHGLDDSRKYTCV